MEGRGVYLRVGLLMVLGTALLVGLVWFLGGTKIEHGALYETYFRESVQGLEVGAPVKFRGVTVGRVTAIGLVTAAYGMGQKLPIDSPIYRLVYVRYLVDIARIGVTPDVALAVKLGLRARIASQGLTGVNYLELDFVDPDRYPVEAIPWKPQGEYIPSVPSTLAQVQNGAQELLARLNEVDIAKFAESLTGLVNDLRSNVNNGEAHAVLVSTERLLQRLDDAIQAADLPGLMTDLRHTASSVRALAQDPALHRTVDGAAQTADRLAAASAQLPPLIAALQATARRADNGTADVQAALLPVLRDIGATVANLREMTESLRRYPNQVLTGGPPPRLAEPAR